MKIVFEPKVATAARIACQHLLVVMAKGSSHKEVFGADALARVHVRLKLSAEGNSAKPDAKPVSADVDGRLVVWVEVDDAAPAFVQHTVLRKALEILAKESPASLAVFVHSAQAQRVAMAARVAFVAVVNGSYGMGKPVTRLRGKRKGVEKQAALAEIAFYGLGANAKSAKSVIDDAICRANGNLLARTLTMRPANDLTPKRYRESIAKLARHNGWKHKEYDYKTLRKVGAGAFCAVAQGSNHQDSAIVHLRYTPVKKPTGKNVASIALVGKGICMDTGGHSLKSAKHMYGMHEDMAGSAVALGILLAATQMKLATPIDVWLAISQNHIGPEAYHPGDVVTALNGTTIEIINTDAEGRMVLADALTLAARTKPKAIVDFATLTGSMIYALGNRMSGVFATSDALAAIADESGAASGERVTTFGHYADYDEALDSKVADVKQCLMGGEADAIYAARFLAKFVGDTPWLHMDLSAYRNEGGLGAVSADVNGFGVGWGIELLKRLASRAGE
jgi:leucyl aminopeptidase